MNDVSLKEHIETQLRWIDRHFETQVKSIDESTRKAAEQIDKRLESMNEFRDSLKDQAQRFMTRLEYNAAHDSIEQRMKSVEITRAQGEGRALMLSGFIAFVASILVAIISHWVIK